MINRIKKDKKGQISVIVVILIMILSYMFSALVDIGGMQWGLRETQTKLDIAGTNALYKSINLDSLRMEVLDVGGSGISSDGTGASTINPSEYEAVIKKAYNNELSSVTYGNSKPQIKYTKVDFMYTDKGLGFKNSSTKKRPQILLESVVSYTVDSSKVTDSRSIKGKKTVTSSLSNTTFTVTIEDKAEDGKSTLLIHSETKLVLK